MAEPKPAARKKREPKQTTFIQPTPQIKNSDILGIFQIPVDSFSNPPGGGRMAA
jgi:hypothetical protein